MPNFSCDNCHNKFSAEDASQCPRCNSKHITLLKEKKEATEASAQPHNKPAQPSSRGPIIMGDTKASWAAYHASEITACPDCGSTEFDFNWKRREKSCKKCGSVFGLKRRGA